MTKRILLVLTVVFLMSGTAQAATKVVVSIVPQQYFVERIGGDLVDVSVMVQPGASPASYEPRPRQMTALSRARLYFSIGVPFESAWLPRMQSASPQLAFFAMDKEIDKRPMVRHRHHGHEHGHDGHGHEDHADAGKQRGIADPHVWTSPPLVKKMAGVIRDALIEADPANGAVYRENHKAFVEDVETLDADLRRLFDQTERKRFMVYHPSWGYFAQAYGLKQIPIELEGKEPGPKELGELISHAEEDDIRVIFVQPQFSDSSAELIAKAIEGEVIKADPLAYDWIDNLRKVAAAFRTALR